MTRTATHTHGWGMRITAIVLGILVGNTLYPRIAAGSAAGVGFSKQILLRAGIILYGLRLTFQDIAGVGLHGVLLDALMLASTFGLACLLGTRLFGLDRTTTLLIGAGSSICGAAAVMATEPVVRGRAEQVAVPGHKTRDRQAVGAAIQRDADLQRIPLGHRGAAPPAVP